MTETKKTKQNEIKKGDMFAVIKLSGSQLKVSEGHEYEVNKLKGEKGNKIEIEEVLLIHDGKDTKIGTPYVEGSKVTLEITSQKKGEKIDGLKFKAKSRYRRRYGYRPEITRVIVKKIA